MSGFRPRQLRFAVQYNTQWEDLKGSLTQAEVGAQHLLSLKIILQQETVLPCNFSVCELGLVNVMPPKVLICNGGTQK